MMGEKLRLEVIKVYKMVFLCVCSACSEDNFDFGPQPSPHLLTSLPIFKDLLCKNGFRAERYCHIEIFTLIFKLLTVFTSNHDH